MDNCLYCKMNFIKNRPHSLYCSKECSINASNLRRKNAYRIKNNYKPTKNKKCPICKKTFESKKHNNIYCSKKCRTKYHNSKEITKIRDKKFYLTEKHQKWLKRYYTTANYKNSVKKIKEKENYKERRKKIVNKYNSSIKGRINSLNNDIKRKHNLKRIKHVFTINEFKLKLEKTKGYCKCCNKYIGIDKLTVDHIIPISKAKDNFEYTITDIDFLCKSCNSKKGDKI